MAKRNTRRKQAEKKRTRFYQEVALWCALAFSIVLFISNFGLGGKVGTALSNFFFGLFGVLTYIFPIGLFIAVAFWVSNLDEVLAKIKVIAGFVFFLCLDGFLQMLTSQETIYTPAEAFQNGFASHVGGGFFGGAVAYLLVPNFGNIGAAVILFILLIISLIIITEKSAINGMKNGSKKIYDSAMNDMERHAIEKEKRMAEREKRMAEREQRLAEKEEQKKLRRERVARGVTADTALTAESLPESTTEVQEPVTPKVVAKDTVEVPPSTGENMHELKIKVAKPEETILPEVAPAAIPPISSEATALPPAEEVPEVRKQERKVKRQSKEEVSSGISGMAEEIKQTASENKRNYVFPPESLLKAGDKNAVSDSKAHLKETAEELERTLQTFGVDAKVTEVSQGPAVTRYEVQPEPGVKVSKIVGLSDDIKLYLKATDIRIEAPIPGKAAVGIEVPNKKSIPVMFGDLIRSQTLKSNKSAIAFGAGKDIGGDVVVADIAKMPHLLIAGATGSGKSVCINTIIMSILYRAHPDDVKLIMIDPKVVELSVYNGIPHLLVPVVTDPKKAAGALNWAVQEMTDRYQKFAAYQVRDIHGYNAKVEGIADIEDENKPQKMPQIVVIVDELADLMMVAPGDVEDAICRLAQLARACGIHLIIATQRPSVNVITGLIKANMPSRIAFSVTSGVDSRTILDMNGAEKLLGKGDMLFYPQGLSKPLRVQGAFVTDEEVSAVVDFLKNNNETVTQDADIEEKMTHLSSGGSGDKGNFSESGDERDSYFLDAAKLIVEKDKASIGMLQRYFKIGFNRAARIMDQLAEAGIVGPEVGTKPREILMSSEQLENYLEENG